MTASRLRRALGFAVFVLTAALTSSSAAVAEPAPVAGTVGNLAVSADHVTGVVNLRAGGQVISIDPGMTAQLNGKDASVSTRPAAQVPRSTVLLIDTSGSMGTSGMATVRAAVKEFVAQAPKDVKVGVVSFGNTAGAEIAPTLDRPAVQKVVDALRADGETALFEGVRQAVTTLGTVGDRSIVLLSDGKNTIGDRQTGLASAVAALTKAQVRVEVVRFTTGENDPAALASFAKAGGGSVAQATDTKAVRAAFLTAAKVLDAQTAFDVTRSPGLKGTVPLVLRGTANGRPFSVRTSVALGSSAPSVAPTTEVVAAPNNVELSTTLVRVPAGPHWGLIAGLCAVFVGALALFIGLADPLFRSRREQRVAQISEYTLAGMSRSGARTEATPSAVAQSLVAVGDRVMAGREATSRTMELISRADLPFRAGEWWVLRVIAVIVGTAAFGLTLPFPWWARFPLGALVGFVVPALLLRFLAARRARKFEDLLPDILMLVATTLASGFSLPQALDAVARDAPEPAGKEFSRALAETRIGAEVSDALDHMSTRMNSENMRWTTMAIRIQREVGGNLAETLRTTAGTLRARQSLRRQVQALSAEGRLSAYILIGLPIALFLYMAWTNYDYVSLLWTTLPGVIMLIGCGIGMVLGSLWLRRIVNIEV